MSCPRCGKSSANKSNPSGRCTGCLKKLRSNKKKPGHHLHEQKIADDALRRQKGKNGTAPGTSRGNGSRKEIIKKVRAGYAKYGKKTTLSPDRRDNKKGYSSSNVRMVPQKLNRGRHTVDSAKLSAWKKRMKKAEITADDLILGLRLLVQERKYILQKSLDEVDDDIIKAELLFDKDALVNILVDSEDNDAEDLIDFVNNIDDMQIIDILSEAVSE